MDISIFDDILPHLKRALNIHTEFTRLRVQYDTLLKEPDRLVKGLILFDRYARLEYMNPTAKAIIQIHPALKINKIWFFLNDQDQNRMLQKTILDAATIEPENSWK